MNSSVVTMEWVCSLPDKIWDAFDTSVRKALEDFAKFVDGREGAGENKSLVHAFFL